MKGNWKRYTVVMTMLVLICAAAVLNWQATQKTSLDGASSSTAQTDGKILGEAALVSGEESEAAGAVTGSTEMSNSDYFASARLTRQQARDNAVTLLQQAANEDGAAQSALDSAAEGIQAMARYTMAEAQIENLVTAKGYADCVAFISADSLSVVVSTNNGKLNGEDVAKITDIAMNETGYSAENIKIMAAN